MIKFEMGGKNEQIRFKELAASGTLDELLTEIGQAVFCFTLILAKASNDELADDFDFMGVVRNSILEFVDAADLIAHGMFDFDDECREISKGIAYLEKQLDGIRVKIDAGKEQTPDSVFIDIGFRKAGE